MVLNVTKQFPNQIVSIILFGSATTNEWVYGKSDIDCIVLIKERKIRKSVETYLHNILLELDTKYNLKLAETCTTYKKTNNYAMNLILKTESMMMFGKPFYVISEDQLDLKNAKIRNNLKMQIGTSVLISLSMFLYRIKCTGKIIYGKDIRGDFPKNIPKIEKFKASINAILLLLMSIIILPIDHRFSFQHVVKANFWACDNVLFALEKPLSDYESEIKEIQKVFSDSDIDIAHLGVSLQYKKKNYFTKITKRFVFTYLLKTSRFILTLYFKTLQKILYS